jgi:hypothetical protein
MDADQRDVHVHDQVKEMSVLEDHQGSRPCRQSQGRQMLLLCVCHSSSLRFGLIEVPPFQCMRNDVKLSEKKNERTLSSSQGCLSPKDDQSV